jgi:putative membrane protein
MKKSLVPMIAGFLVLAACAHSHKNEDMSSSTGGTSSTTTSKTTSTTAPTASTTTTSAMASGPTDPQIANIVVTADTIDIDNGKLAKSKTKDPEVKKFAEQMITDHTAVNKMATDLAKKLKVKPEESDTSKSLKADADTVKKQLKDLKGKEFDKAYVDREVAFHQSVLDAIDKTLIPSAKNEELKALIEKVRPNIQAHLEHAKHLQSTMQ